MSTYRVRRLHCLTCDQPVSARNLVVGDTEVCSRCPECNSELVSIGKLDLSAKGLWYRYATAGGMPGTSAKRILKNLEDDTIWDELSDQILSEWNRRCDEEGC